jgi:hypothetical protein
MAGAHDSAAFGTVVHIGGDLFRSVPADGDAVRGLDDDRRPSLPRLFDIKDSTARESCPR